MKKFSANQDGWFCGHWNGSPVQIKHSYKRPLKKEKPHSHEFAEYYLVLDGTLTLKLNSKKVEVKKSELLMVEAGEKHSIVNKSPNLDYIIIKEKSFPHDKS